MVNPNQIFVTKIYCWNIENCDQTIKGLNSRLSIFLFTKTQIAYREKNVCKWSCRKIYVRTYGINKFPENFIRCISLELDFLSFFFYIFLNCSQGFAPVETARSGNDDWEWSGLGFQLFFPSRPSGFENIGAIVARMAITLVLSSKT